MTEPGPIARAAVAEAEAHVGEHESGGQNRGTEVELYLESIGLEPGQPWCGAFVAWCIARTAMRLGDAYPGDGFPDGRAAGWTPNYAVWARRTGNWIPIGDARETPSLVRRGDLALFWFEPAGRIAHVGFVTGLLPPSVGSGVSTVEGNTPRKSRTDGVWLKGRPWSDLGRKGGFARLPF